MSSYRCSNTAVLKIINPLIRFFFIWAPVTSAGKWMNLTTWFSNPAQIIVVRDLIIRHNALLVFTVLLGEQLIFSYFLTLCFPFLFFGVPPPPAEVKGTIFKWGWSYPLDILMSHFFSPFVTASPFHSYFQYTTENT